MQHVEEIFEGTNLFLDSEFAPQEHSSKKLAELAFQVLMQDFGGAPHILDKALRVRIEQHQDKKVIVGAAIWLLGEMLTKLKMEERTEEDRKSKMLDLSPEDLASQFSELHPDIAAQYLIEILSAVLFKKGSISSGLALKLRTVMDKRVNQLK